jgi:carbon monoxide dehydrogenase subunit G
MKLEQSFEVTAPLDRVWAALIDVERVAPCLPGADVTGRNDDGSYNGSFRVKLGPTAAAYVGKLEMESIDEPSHTATMLAEGTDRRGQGSAKATIISSVKEAAPGTAVVEVLTEYSITGRLARFGRGGTIEEIGDRLLKEFAASLQVMLAGPGEYETFVAMPAVAADGGSGAKPEKPKRKPRKDLTAAADAVAAASKPAAESSEPVAAESVAAEPEPVVAEPALGAEDVPDLALEAAAEEELAAIVPEASLESEPPGAEVPQQASEPEIEPPAPEPVPEPTSEPEVVPPAPEPVSEPTSGPEVVPPAPEPVSEPTSEPEVVPPAPEPVPEPAPLEPPEPPELPELPELPEPPAPPEPPQPPPPPPPPPPATEAPPPPASEAEPLDGLALMRTVIIARIKSNPVPTLALVFAIVFLLRRRGGDN